MNLLVKLFLCLLLLTPAAAQAELPKQIELDYSVLSGYVIMPINDEYIVDLDASDNLHVGDILTLVSLGQKVFHPVTGESLGSVDVPNGFLQVTRLHSGYSYAKVLAEGVEPKNGEQVRRFEQVPAFFVDKRGDDGSLSGQIKAELPQFRWLQEGDNEEILLTFTLKNDALIVKTHEGHLLHKYAVKDNQQLVAKPEIVRPSYVASAPTPKKSLLKNTADSVLDVFHLGDEDPFSPENMGIMRQNSEAKQGIWRSPNLNGHPVGVAVADLDSDGMQEIAIALSNSLKIVQINQGDYLEKAEVPIPSWLTLLSLDAIDLDKDGHPELYLTAKVGYELASFMVKFNGTDYEIAINKVRWFLRVVELTAGEPVLIGQAISNDASNFFGNPFQIHLEGNTLVKGEEFKLPGLANMYSFMPFTDQEGQPYYVYLTAGDYLKVVSAAGVEMWESGEYYGGSETCFDNRPDGDGYTVLPTCIPPRMLKTADNEVVVAQNDGQRLMQRYRKYKESRLLALSWNGFALEENWRTSSQKGYLGDFTLADADNDGIAEVVMAVKFKHAGYVDKARSAIVLYELD